MFSSIILALSVSLDSLGIGVTYGVKNAKILFPAKCLLFVMSICFTSASFFMGNFINSLFSETITAFISSIILVLMGIIVITDPIPFDFNHSNGIDLKEAFFLGLALSLDSICVGVTSSIGGFYNFTFPILASSFQLIFLSVGNYLGKKLAKHFKVPKKALNVISRYFLSCIWNNKINILANPYA